MVNKFIIKLFGENYELSTDMTKNLIKIRESVYKKENLTTHYRQQIMDTLFGINRSKKFLTLDLYFPDLNISDLNIGILGFEINNKSSIIIKGKKLTIIPLFFIILDSCLILNGSDEKIIYQNAFFNERDYENSLDKEIVSLYEKGPYNFLFNFYRWIFLQSNDFISIEKIQEQAIEHLELIKRMAYGSCISSIEPIV